MMKFNVKRMSCSHCTNTIINALLELDQNAKVTCDLPSSTLAIKSSLSESEIKAAIEAAGYEAS